MNPRRLILLKGMISKPISGQLLLNLIWVDTVTVAALWVTLFTHLEAYHRPMSLSTLSNVLRAIVLSNGNAFN